MTNEGGGGCMRDSPRSPTVKTNGSRFEGNRIINPHSPDSKVNKQTNKHGRFGRFVTMNWTIKLFSYSDTIYLKRSGFLVV